MTYIINASIDPTTGEKFEERMQMLGKKKSEYIEWLIEQDYRVSRGVEVGKSQASLLEEAEKRVQVLKLEQEKKDAQDLEFSELNAWFQGHPASWQVKIMEWFNRTSPPWAPTYWAVYKLQQAYEAQYGGDEFFFERPARDASFDFKAFRVRVLGV